MSWNIAMEEMKRDYPSIFKYRDMMRAKIMEEEFKHRDLMMGLHTQGNLSRHEIEREEQRAYTLLHKSLVDLRKNLARLEEEIANYLAARPLDPIVVQKSDAT